MTTTTRSAGASRWLTAAALVAVVGVTLGPLAAKAAKPSKELILATTTSTQDTGLLDLLVPVFERASDYRVKTIAVGSGQAMALGARGEADVLLVHSPAAEEAFMADGAGSRRLLVMHNDFLLVGPGNDPAGVGGAGTAVEALRRIAAMGAIFLSRGDNSGTHALEKKLWKAAGIDPLGKGWYQETGLGMGQTLAVAAEKVVYTLSDRGTWLVVADKAALPILLEGDPALLNNYRVIEVNATRWPKVNAAGARAFADFLVSEQGQGLIRGFGVDKFGRGLFIPDAGPESKAGETGEESIVPKSVGKPGERRPAATGSTGK